MKSKLQQTALLKSAQRLSRFLCLHQLVSVSQRNSDNACLICLNLTNKYDINCEENQQVLTVLDLIFSLSATQLDRSWENKQHFWKTITTKKHDQIFGILFKDLRIILGKIFNF